MRDKYISTCPFCHGTEMILASQDSNGRITGVDNSWGGIPLYHVVCRNCGSIVRSMVTDREKLLNRKDRREKTFGDVEK